MNKALIQPDDGRDAAGLQPASAATADEHRQAARAAQPAEQYG
jgi:hypothetical protein